MKELWKSTWRKKEYTVYCESGIQAKLGYGGLVLGSSQFQVMTDPPQQLLLKLKVFLRNTKIIISLL